MRRRIARPQPSSDLELTTSTRCCPSRDGPPWAACKNRRAVIALDAVLRLAVQVRRCRHLDCPRLGVPIRPEHEGRIALPESEFGLDVVAFGTAGAYQTCSSKRISVRPSWLSMPDIIFPRRLSLS